MSGRCSSWYGRAGFVRLAEASSGHVSNTVKHWTQPQRRSGSLSPSSESPWGKGFFSHPLGINAKLYGCATLELLSYAPWMPWVRHGSHLQLLQSSWITKSLLRASRTLSADVLQRWFNAWWLRLSLLIDCSHPRLPRSSQRAKSRAALGIAVLTPVVPWVPVAEHPGLHLFSCGYIT